MAGVDRPASATPRYSSSPELSTPPRSPSDSGSPSARQILNDHHEAQNFIVYGAAPIPSAPPPRKKPGRKPKVPVDGASATTADAKPKRTRKPRDPNAPPAQRKKKAVAQDGDALNNKTQLTIDEMTMRPADQPAFRVLAEPFHTAQKGNFEDIQRSTPASFFNAPPPPHPQPAPVRTSGQNYDPIRSNYDPVRETTTSNNYNSQFSPKPPHITNRASASPSISSLVDPPHQAATSPSMATQSFFQHQMKMQNSVPPSPTSNRAVPSSIMNPSAPPQSAIQSAVRVRQEEPPAPAPSKPRVHAPPAFTANPAQIISIAAASSASSAAPSPKPPKPVDVTPPPLPGQGNALFNGPKDGTDSRAPTIVLHIPLNGGNNKYVNFTRLAEERYGWDALHPRLAAQRERLARVAAAGAALERSGHKESGDEMSLDISDAEGDNSNVEMGGMSDGRTATDGGAKKVVKKRRMKEDDYDKSDEFVDDSDLLWEEQAAASVDGFFVYSGPLVPEGEKPTVERADGTTKRTRGSRGGRGGRSAAGTTRGGGAAGTGGGPGSRGGATTRKPRITKADRARRDAEKLEREKMGAMAARPSTYVLGGAVGGGTQMVFNQ